MLRGVYGMDSSMSGVWVPRDWRGLIHGQLSESFHDVECERERNGRLNAHSSPKWPEYLHGRSLRVKHIITFVTRISFVLGDNSTRRFSIQHCLHNLFCNAFDDTLLAIANYLRCTTRERQGQVFRLWLCAESEGHGGWITKFEISNVYPSNVPTLIKEYEGWDCRSMILAATNTHSV